MPVTIISPQIEDSAPLSASGPTMRRALANWRKLWHWELSSHGKYEPARVIPFTSPEHLLSYLHEVYETDHLTVIVDGVTTVLRK